MTNRTPFPDDMQARINRGMDDVSDALVSYYRLLDALHPDAVEDYLRGLSMDSLTADERFYVMGNVRGFAAHLQRLASEGLWAPQGERE